VENSELEKVLKMSEHGLLFGAKCPQSFVVKSVIIPYLTSFSASNQSFVPHFYHQIMNLILIPQYSPQNESKSPHRSTIARYVCDF
jgi:hypothetical protein